MATIYHGYLKSMHKTYMTGDATEPSYYPLLKELLENFSKESGQVAGIPGLVAGLAAFRE